MAKSVQRNPDSAPGAQAPPEGLFPQELAAGVFRCGFNARSSFGAHVYLVVRPEGNLLIDSPLTIRYGLVAIPLPGHTKGSVAYLLEDTYLFTGDSLAWSRDRQRLIA